MAVRPIIGYPMNPGGSVQPQNLNRRRRKPKRTVMQPMTATVSPQNASLMASMAAAGGGS